MAVAVFDTAKSVDNLEAVKMSREQARAIVELVRSSHEAADVATKGDIELLRKDMTNIEQRLDARIDSMRKDIIIWLGGLLIAGFGLVVGLVLKMPH